MRDDIIIYASGQILKEVFTTCSKPVFKAREVNPYQVIEILNISCQLVAFKSLFQLSPDPDDNFLFDMYLQWYCDVIITAEKALLNFWKEKLQVRNIQWLKENFPH